MEHLVVSNRVEEKSVIHSGGSRGRGNEKTKEIKNKK